MPEAACRLCFITYVVTYGMPLSEANYWLLEKMQREWARQEISTLCWIFWRKVSATNLTFHYERRWRQGMTWDTAAEDLAVSGRPTLRAEQVLSRLVSSLTAKCISVISTNLLSETFILGLYAVENRSLFLFWSYLSVPQSNKVHFQHGKYLGVTKSDLNCQPR